MTSKLNLMRVTALAGVALALLASCGGGTQIEQFAPNRIVVFGDEQSLMVAGPGGEGVKYTVNGVERAADGTTLTTTRRCARNPIWVQQLATNYGFEFAECLTPGRTAGAFNYAQANSTVAMVAAQVTANGGTLNTKDLVAVMAGTHDIVAALGTANPVATVEAAAALLGQQVVNMTDRGAKVIISTLPDVGATPAGRTSGQAALLTTLTERFNSRLRIKLQEVRGGGHSAGLVLGDELVLVMLRSPATYGINGAVPEAISQAACATALPNCDENDTYLTAQAIATGAHAADWLWAGPYQLGPNAQTRLGSVAINRARSNPFY